MRRRVIWALSPLWLPLYAGAWIADQILRRLFRPNDPQAHIDAVLKENQ